MKTETEIKKELRQIQALKRASEKEYIPHSDKIKDKRKQSVLNRALRDVIMSYQAQIDILNWALKPSTVDEAGVKIMNNFWTNTKKAEDQMKLKERSDKAIRNIPFERANAIKDREGFVEVLGFGKIHIDNWKK